MNNLTATEIKNELDLSLKKELGSLHGKIEFLSQSAVVADGVSVFKLYNIGNELHAVLLCSPSLSPNLVKRSTYRAQQAKAHMDVASGKHILEPILEGKIHDLTYSVLPYCYELSKKRLLRKTQNVFLKKFIFEWLLGVTQCSIRDVDATSVEANFRRPLHHIASLTCLNEQIKQKASIAIDRLSSNLWNPKYVVMHGDLWSGNILLRSKANILNTVNPSDNFVITDWAGSEVNGYAIYDLIRCAESMHLSSKKLKLEINKHCDLLQCDFDDATSYLLASLGFIAMHLEHFPLERFVKMTESCFSTISKASH